MSMTAIAFLLFTAYLKLCLEQARTTTAAVIHGFEALQFFSERNEYDTRIGRRRKPQSHSSSMRQRLLSNRAQIVCR